MSDNHQFRIFLHALATTVDAKNASEGRDDLLRAVGRRMAQLMPIDNVRSMVELEIEINEVLSAMGWGTARMTLREAERYLLINHSGLPRIGSKGDPAGFWLAAVLEGLIEAWMAQQPSADPALTVRRKGLAGDGSLELHYRRPEGARRGTRDDGDLP